MPSTLGPLRSAARREPRTAHSPRPSIHKGSESIDDYLKAIFALGGAEGRRVGSTALAERLQVAPASITNMLQKLAAAQNPLVEYERHRGVRLSPLGRRRALEIVRHHRLIETFLHRMLDYELDELHEEAERLEHFISERFEARIDAKLGYPDVDPHGACIPALDGTMPPRHRLTCKCPE
jgi:DtxR family Mn-dependent transcriptional regulator